MEIQARDRLSGSLVQTDERQRIGSPSSRLALAQDAVADAEHRTEKSILEHRHRTERKRALHGHRDPLASDLVCGQTIDPLATEPHAAVRRAL